MAEIGPRAIPVPFMVSNMPSIPFLKSILAAGVLALGVQATEAATYTFSFGGVSTTSFSQPGLTLNVAAQEFNVSGGTKTLTATSGTVATGSASGIGERLNTILTIRPDRVDSYGADSLREALSFNFDQAVKLVNVTFTDIITGSTGLVFIGGTADSALNAFAVGSSVNFSGYSGSSIGIGAKAGAAFYISSITVETVPVPAAGLLLGSLVVVPFLRRKRRAA